MAGENPTDDNSTDDNSTNEHGTNEHGANEHGAVDVSDASVNDGADDCDTATDVVSTGHGTRPELHPDIRDIRESIDNIDAALVHLLAERFKFTRRVGELKAATGMIPKDSGREAWQLNRLRRIAEDSGLDPLFAEKFQGFVTAEVIRHHHRIAGTDSEPDTVA